MATLLIRNLDESVKRRLRLQAAEHGRSMEEEARAILRSGLANSDSAIGLAQEIHARFARLGGVALKLPKREPMREPPNFSE